ncbi:hypothetical protein [Aneurinibacillus terranovensis]|uniref:hypothetical protein n=1 Tax=Aneurinibacillus terranovensis TaxID=278991 RepID=UPI0003FA2E68|nr:hypothetical protein [Aneurinibacillus terranovensis]
MAEYKIYLSPAQLDVLQDTVRSFVDNQKLVHVPADGNQVVGLPLTEEALAWLIHLYEEKKIQEKSEVLIDLKPAVEDVSEVEIKHSASGMNFIYHVKFDEFAEQ